MLDYERFAEKRLIPEYNIVWNVHRNKFVWC